MQTEDKLASINVRQKQRPRHELGRAWWLLPKPFDLVSSALYIAVVVTFFLYGCSCDFATWRAVVLIAVTLVLLSIDRVEYWWYGEETPVRDAAVLLTIRVVLIEIVALLDNFNFSPFLYLILPFLACLYFGHLVSYGVALLAWIANFSNIMLRDPAWYLQDRIGNNLIVFTLGLIFAITMAGTVVKEKVSRVRAEQLLTELETSHQQLKAYSEQVGELATTRERNRLARDIHDTLGHYLTVINVQLEKALAFREKKPQEAEQAVSDAKRLASEALQDVRHSVGALRTTQDVFSFLSAMRQLVARMDNDQYSITLSVEGSEAGFSQQSLLALYRATQEGLTNIHKHAGASSVQIIVRFSEQEAQLSLCDDGHGFDALNSQQEGGYGLLGVRERLELVGGYLRVASKPGEGTCLFAVTAKAVYG